MWIKTPINNMYGDEMGLLNPDITMFLGGTPQKKQQQHESLLLSNSFIYHLFSELLSSLGNPAYCFSLQLFIFCVFSTGIVGTWFELGEQSRDVQWSGPQANIYAQQL